MLVMMLLSHAGDGVTEMELAVACHDVTADP
jgi:hypothetical protein